MPSKIFNSSIRHKSGIPKSTTSPGQSEPKRNCNAGVLHISQKYSGYI